MLLDAALCHAVIHTHDALIMLELHYGKTDVRNSQAMLDAILLVS